MNTDKTKLLIRVYLRSSAAIMLFATGCGRYANFTLPEVPGGDASLVFRFVAEPEPVIARDEFRDVLNPSVAGRVNLYSVYDGQWHTALATSEDGVHWRKQGIVLRAAAGSYIAANGSAVSYGGQFWYWYETGAQDRLRISLARPRIGVARSADGVHWEKLRANPVVEMDEEEAGIGEPAVWQSDGFYWMLY